MSLLLLKTKDLTWQDRALNLEVMLEPKRTNLLFKKNKSLSMNYVKDSIRYEKQANTSVRMMKNEKYYIDKKNQELYLVKTKRFLGSLSSEQRQKLLSRKSFSIGLSKLAKEIEEEEEYNERYSAPSSFSTRRVSVFGSFGSFASSTMNSESSVNIQELVTPTTEDPEPEPEPEPDLLLPKLPNKARGAPRLDRRYMSPDIRRFRSADDVTIVDIEDVSKPNTPIPSYLPSVSPLLGPDLASLRTKYEDIKIGETKNEQKENETPRKVVKFEDKADKVESPRITYESEKIKAEIAKPQLQRKVNSFLVRQSKFNKRVPVFIYKKNKSSVNPEDPYNIDKGKVVNAFDDLINKGGKDNFQRLKKYATKFKVASSFKNTSNVLTSSVDNFRTSRTFMTMANAAHVQQISSLA
ncbi:hypothetical protein FSP39_005181 [Pinctada imbricata]|uniref:Uncharacterized protein n=1 Tax=Pinctada imbricata TaxID=66713 RepID=A0AA89BU26_PINIB|nr:hypothetical protein FSP39_005181 [Pinctada imbricata]